MVLTGGMGTMTIGPKKQCADNKKRGYSLIEMSAAGCYRQCIGQKGSMIPGGAESRVESSTVPSVSDSSLWSTLSFDSIIYMQYMYIGLFSHQMLSVLDTPLQLFLLPKLMPDCYYL